MTIMAVMSEQVSVANGYGRMEFPRARHGTLYAHKMGCRCRPCMDRYNQVIRDYYAARRAAGTLPARRRPPACTCPDCRARRAAAARRSRARRRGDAGGH